MVDPAATRPETATIASLKADRPKISAQPPFSRDGLSGLMPLPPVTETVEKRSISPLKTDTRWCVS
eukprot:COSAG06_NODE_34017_length_481_cov_0.424084_1_plen_65_part_10